jgi:hypothetical protein
MLYHSMRFIPDRLHRSQVDAFRIQFFPLSLFEPIKHYITTFIFADTDDKIFKFTQ